MIEAEGLSKVFDGFQAVSDITVRVEAGTVLAVLGPNGAGKTTTVRMLTSILTPSAGWARVAGYDVVSQARQVRANVGVLTEQHGLYDRMKALDYLDFFAKIYHLPKALRRQRSLQLMERFGLGNALDKRLGSYSKGMKQKLALVRSMLHDPPVLLLDEPTSAMDPQSAKLVREAIMELRRDRRTVILTTHNLTEASLLADSIAIIRNGRIIAKGTFEELAQLFVGPPVMRLTFQGPLNGSLEGIAALVQVQGTGEGWLDFISDDPASTNPPLLRYMVAQGIEVTTLSQRPRSLEDVYLRIVEEDENREQQEPQA